LRSFGIRSFVGRRTPDRGPARFTWFARGGPTKAALHFVLCDSPSDSISLLLQTVIWLTNEQLAMHPAPSLLQDMGQFVRQ
jgi:hypothetical protein